MITDLCDDREVPDGLSPCPRVSAWSSPGRLNPPIASPPILRNDLRDWPSQYRVCPPGPHKVSMVDRSLPRRGQTGSGPVSSRTTSSLSDEC